jgi:hypothetical protein
MLTKPQLMVKLVVALLGISASAVVVMGWLPFVCDWVWGKVYRL